MTSLLGRLLAFQLLVLLGTTRNINEQQHRRSSFFLVDAAKSGSNNNGFNHEIEKRVFERVSELMSAPARMIETIEHYSTSHIFEPPFLRPHQKKFIFRFMWSQWKASGLSIYYGQEDGLFLGISDGSGTYLEGRGSNGYRVNNETEEGQPRKHLSEEDSYMQRLYYSQCLDRETGAKQNCTLQPMEEYISCVNECLPIPCPSPDALKDSAKTSSLLKNRHQDAETTTSNSTMSPENTMYCPNYEVFQVPSDDSMGYIPRYYYCLSKKGKFIENVPPNSVASPSSMKDGRCTYIDGFTPVNGRVAIKQTYAMADRRNYVFLRDFSNERDGPSRVSTSHDNPVYATSSDALQLYRDDPEFVEESQKSDEIFVGGHHSRRYDPRFRPWYTGTRERQSAFWTKPYPFATSNKLGISYSKPVYFTDPLTGHSIFRGAFLIDYDLEKISNYLSDIFLEIRRDRSSTREYVLIVEDDTPHYIIGTSTGSKAAENVRIDDESIKCNETSIIKGSFECKTVRLTLRDSAAQNNSTSSRLDGAMALAFEAQKDAGFPKELVVSKAPPPESINNGVQESDMNRAEFYVSQSLFYEQTEGVNLKWRIIVAIPVGNSDTDELLNGDTLFVVVCIVGVFGFVACMVLFGYYFRHRNSSEVRVSDWVFTSAFILGCAALNLTTLTQLGPVTNATCMLRMWAFHLIFVMALAPLLVKVWRMYKLVGSASRASRLTITNRQAAMYTLPAILLQGLILTMFSIFDPPIRNTYVDVDGSNIYQRSECKHRTVAFMVTQIIFEGCLVVCGCILAFKTRNLGSTFGEAKQLLFAMYNVALVGLIVLVMGSLLELNHESLYLIIALGVLWATVFSSCAFVLPRLMQIYKENQEPRVQWRVRRSSRDRLKTSLRSTKEAAAAAAAAAADAEIAGSEDE